MNKVIMENIAKFRPYQQKKYLNGRIRAPLQNIIAEETLQILRVYITSPFKSPYIPGIINYFSKYLCFIPLRTTQSETVSEAIGIHWISKFGIPGRIHSDKGSNFSSSSFENYPKSIGIKKHSHSLTTHRVFRTAKPMISSNDRRQKNRRLE